MTCNVNSSGHWTNVFENLWTNLLNSGQLHRGKPNHTGADFEICLSGGKILLHSSQIVKFTTILDFAKEKLQDYVDPWGILTQVMPHFKLATFEALGRLMYCGDSGNVSEEVMQDINRILKPEFREKSNSEAGRLTRLIDKANDNLDGLQKDNSSGKNSDPNIIVLDDEDKDHTPLQNQKRTITGSTMSSAKSNRKSKQSERDSNAMKANSNKLSNQITTLHDEEVKGYSIWENEKLKPMDMAAKDVDSKVLDIVNMSPECEFRDDCGTDMDIENSSGDPSINWSPENSDTESTDEVRMTASDKVAPDESHTTCLTSNTSTSKYPSATPSHSVPSTSGAESIFSEACPLIPNRRSRTLESETKKIRAYGIPLTLREIINTSTIDFHQITLELTGLQIDLCRAIRRRGKNQLTAKICRQRKLDFINNLADEVGSAKKYKEKLLAEQDQLCHLKTEWSNKLQHLEESILRGMNRDPSQWKLEMLTTSTSGDRVSVIARVQKEQ